MRLFLAAITTAALFWLAVMVTIARIVLDNIVAVSLGVVVVAAVLIASLLRRARSRAHRSWPAAITGRPLAVVPARQPHPPVRSR